jgi:hypothetical protein
MAAGCNRRGFVKTAGTPLCPGPSSPGSPWPADARIRIGRGARSGQSGASVAKRYSTSDSLISLW